jgi:hypothetical protein
VKSLILLSINLGSDVSDVLLRFYLLYIIIIYSNILYEDGETFSSTIFPERYAS